MNIFRLFKKVPTVPLPSYPEILVEDIPPASAILFYGGNKLTEIFGNRGYGHPYKPPAFHAAIYLGMPEPGLFLNVGKFKTLELLPSEFRSKRRIDVVVYKKISDGKRREIVTRALLDSSRPKVGLSLPDYGITDYLRFGFKFLRPSKKDFCSENVAELLAGRVPDRGEKATAYWGRVALEGGFCSSGNLPVDTSPWDMLEYAESHPSECEIFTAWIGDDFKG